jgi:hypothetical protein
VVSGNVACESTLTREALAEEAQTRSAALNRRSILMLQRMVWSSLAAAHNSLAKYLVVQ